MLYCDVPSWITRSAIAVVAIGAVVAAAAGCSGEDQTSSPTSGLTSITPNTGDPVMVVDASDYITDSNSNGDNYYGFEIVSAFGERITECSLGPIAVSTTTVTPGGHYPACSATFPSDTPPVSSPPFQGPPNAVRIGDDGIADYISEGFTGPNVTLKELPPNSRIVVGDAECLSLPEGGVDCSKGYSSFRYTPGSVVKRIATVPEGTHEEQLSVEPSTTAQVAPPIEGPYTEGTTPVVPGTACGAATGEKIVEVVSGSISCTDARGVMERYWALPNDGSYGNANIRQFDGWSCVSPTAASAQEQGFASKCSKDDIVLTAPI